MKPLPIERKKAIKPEDFGRDHLTGAGMPVIVTDAATQWPALRTWTLRGFGERFGGDLVPISYYSGAPLEKLVKLSDFLACIERGECDVPGIWVDRHGLPAAPPHTSPQGAPYLMSWYAFQRHPELYGDVMQTNYFVSDWVARLSEPVRKAWEAASNREFWSIYVGPAGTVTPLHQDFWRTHSCLTQVLGSKRMVLFSPESADLPPARNTDELAQIENAVAYECELRAGEMLFMPAGWWHWVEALETSVTVSHNFFNETNVSDYMEGLMQRLPQLTREIDRAPDIRNALKIDWRMSDWAALA